MANYINIRDAKDAIMEELQNLEKQNKRPKIKIKDLYKGNKQWSKTFFKAGKELNKRNKNIEMSIKGGFHHIELTN